MQNNDGRSSSSYDSRQSAWDVPERPRRSVSLTKSGSDQEFRPQKEARRLSGKASVRSVVLIMVLVLCMLTNTVYAGARAVFSNLDIVGNRSDEPVTQLSVSTADELNSLGEDEFDTSNLIISDKDVEVFLLVGSDARLGEEGARSDTMMILAIDRINKKLKLISIMRDLYAPISGVKGSNKINFAYYYDSAKKNYDLSVTRATIQDCFGITIDHFAVVDFDVFVEFIEALGEIEVEMTANEAAYMVLSDRWYQPRYMGCKEAGVYSLNGKESLAYCRMRYTGEGDFDRTRRQRHFIELLIERAKTMSYVDIVKTITVVLPYITTDLNENQIFGYCFDAPQLLSYEMVQLRFPIEGSYYMSWATIGSTNVSVLLTNYTFCAQAMQDFIYNNDMTYVNGAEATGVAKPTITTKSFTTTTEAPEIKESAPAEEDTSEETDDPPDTEPEPAPEEESDESDES